MGWWWAWATSATLSRSSRCGRCCSRPRQQHPGESLLIVAESGTKLFCLMVDELIGKQEVVIKSLGEGMRNIAGVAGGGLLGDGRVGLILDPEGLFGSTKVQSRGE